MVGMFMPGPMELLILVVIGGVCGAPVVILLALLATGKLRCSRRESTPCPSCGGWTLPGASFCHQCGEPVETPRS